jgi:hypothetical protein
MSEAQQIAPDQPLTVTLPAAQWQTVLTVLAEGPHRVVNSLINEIQRQCMAGARPRHEMRERSMRVNGAAATAEVEVDRPL